MAAVGAVSHSPSSSLQLPGDDRKQRAHLRKGPDMQRPTASDNGAPSRFAHLHQGFAKQMNVRHQEIFKENQLQAKRLATIMAARPSPPPVAARPANSHRAHQAAKLSHDHAEYLERLAKVKGKYDVQQWSKAYDQHKEYLKMRQNHRQRVKTSSFTRQDRSTSKSSTFDRSQQSSIRP